MSKLLDKREVAERLGVTTRTVNRLMASGALAYHRVTPGPRGAVRFHPDDVAAFLAEARVDHANDG